MKIFIILKKKEIISLNMQYKNITLFNSEEENLNLDQNKNIFINRDIFINILSDLEKIEEIGKLKIEIHRLLEIINNPDKDKLGILNITSNGDTIRIRYNILYKELSQIQNSLTLERSKYYIKRLKKSLKEEKTTKVNDLNLNRWKEYEDIITDSLWILNKRDNSGAHNASYWGNFIPQIPNQFFRRYTKKGEWILDPFLGSGTSLIECKRLGRNGIGVELLPEVIEIARNNINKEKNPHKIITEVINGDSTKFDFKSELSKKGIKSVQFLIMHPPYWNIIKFSNNNNDLSNAHSIEHFLELFGKVVDNTFDILDKERYFALVIGDKYSNGEWIPLAFYTMNEVLKRDYTLKSIIIKNFEETKGKMNQKELWRYRALVGGFYVFKHEYIFLFKKGKK